MHKTPKPNISIKKNMSYTDNNICLSYETFSVFEDYVLNNDSNLSDKPDKHPSSDSDLNNNSTVENTVEGQNRGTKTTYNSSDFDTFLRFSYQTKDNRSEEEMRSDFAAEEENSDNKYSVLGYFGAENSRNEEEEDARLNEGEFLDCENSVELREEAMSKVPKLLGKKRKRSKISTAEKALKQHIVDYYIKYFKTSVNKYITRQINEKIINKRYKCYSICHKNFTNIATLSFNQAYFRAKITEILLIKNGEKASKNLELLNHLKDEQRELYEELNRRSYEEIIDEFYDSADFEEFRNKDKTKKYEEIIKDKCNVSFLVKGGIQNFIYKRKI